MIELSGERVNLMKRRAKIFMQLAKDLQRKGLLDITSFHVHQACQLRIKATLLRLLGEIPRIHGIRELLGILAKKLEDLGFIEESNKIIELIRENRGMLIDLENAYTESKYGIVSPTERMLNDMIIVVEKIFKLLDEIEKRVLG